jgi:arylformamidase
MPGCCLDISVPITPDMLVWSTHERPAMATNESAYAGGRTRVTTLRLTTHTGTHVDAPYHFLEDGSTVDQLPLGDLIGPARVYDFRGQAAITADLLAAAGAGPVERALLRTDNSAWIRTGPLPAVPAHLTEDAARYLVEQGIRLLGIDGLTVDAPDTLLAHDALLRAGVIILETLDLSQVESGDYELICLPLRIIGVDGAPARAVLRSR